MLRNPRFILIVTLIIVIPFVAYNLISSKSNKHVLSDQTQNSGPNPSPSPSSIPSTSPSPVDQPSKSSYTIAIIGDSMVDTMGEKLEYLDKSLKSIYPSTQFKLYNYGVGGENVQIGLARFNKTLTYKDRSFPALSNLNADIVIVGSFAYNPFPAHDPAKHYALLSQLAQEAAKTKAAVYLLAEIAPLGDTFGKGTNGVNWPPDVAKMHAINITQQLDNVAKLSNSNNLTLVNAYAQSQANGNFGNGAFTDGNDGIHPSVQGHVLMANLIARTIKLK